MIRPAKEGIRWPALKLCAALRNAPEGPACICRQYDGAEGFYVIGEDGHAVAYYGDRADAKRKDQETPRPPEVPEPPPDAPMPALLPGMAP